MDRKCGLSVHGHLYLILTFCCSYAARSREVSMWQRIGLITLAATIATPVCAKEYSLDFMRTVSQASRLERGVEIIDSVQQNTAVRIVEIVQPDKKTVSFVIGVLNKGNVPFVFGPENVTVRPAGFQPMALVTYDDAMAVERKRQKRERFLGSIAALSRNMSAADAGTRYSSGSYSGISSGMVGGQPVSGFSSGSFSVTTHDSGAQLAAQRDAAALNRQARNDLEARWAMRSASHDTLLRPTTVDPGAVFGGYAKFNINRELSKAQASLPITIDVVVGSERHIFVAQLNIIK
jgi:hypothetical protein